MGLLLLALLATAARADSMDIGYAVHEIFERRCAQCHGPDVARPKGDFGHVLDLERLGKDTRYVVAGSPDASPLFQLVRDGKMHPRDVGEPLSDVEIRRIRIWIDLGAKPGEAPRPGATNATEKTPALLVGQLHPLTVHFPIVLLIGAVLLEILAHARASKPLARAARVCLVLGAAGALGATLTGWLWASSEGYAAHTHRWLAVGATLCALGAVALRMRITDASPRTERVGYAIALGLTLVLIVLASHHGGTITHGPRVMP